MKFRPEKRKNPFDNFAVSMCAHVVGLGGAAAGIYWSVMDQSMMPLGLAFLVLTGLEGAWPYYSLRR